MGASILFGFTPSLKHSDFTLLKIRTKLFNVVLELTTLPRQRSAPKVNLWLVSHHPACCVCKQSTASVEESGDEEINISTVISLLCLTCGAGWGRQRVKVSHGPCSTGFQGKQGEAAHLPGGQSRCIYPPLLCTHRENKTGWAQKTYPNHSPPGLIPSPHRARSLGITGNISSCARQQRPWGFHLPGAFSHHPKERKKTQTA